jgi:hypothetical protein
LGSNYFTKGGCETVLIFRSNLRAFSLDLPGFSEVESDRLRDPPTGFLRQQIILAGAGGQGGERDGE